MTNTNIQTQPVKPTSVAALFNNDQFKKGLMNALPRHISADRMLRVALTEVNTNPKLKECTAESFARSLIKSSQLGLEPGVLGQAYLLPRKNKREGTVECELMIGYRGMIELARRSGQIKTIEAHVVDESDEFDFSFGLNPVLKHKPSRESSGNIIYVYALATLKDGGHQFDVMSKQDINKIVNSLRYPSNIWRDHFDEMCRKTAIRRLFKMLPSSPEMADALLVEDKGVNTVDYSDNMAMNIDVTDIQANTKTQEVAEDLLKLAENIKE